MALGEIKQSLCHCCGPLYHWFSPLPVLCTMKCDKEAGWKMQYEVVTYKQQFSGEEVKVHKGGARVSQ